MTAHLLLCVKHLRRIRLWRASCIKARVNCEAKKFTLADDWSRQMRKGRQEGRQFMEIFIEDVTTAHQLREVSAVRREVFEKEWRLKTRQLQFDTQNKVWHLLARAADFGPAIGALSVVDTTADDTLHQNYALHFPENARVARLTQLAVLVSFRGRGIPYQLIHEAIHQI